MYEDSQCRADRSHHTPEINKGLYCFACEIPHRCRLRQWSTCEVSTNSDQQRCHTTTIHQKNLCPFLIFSIGQNIQKVRELKSKLKEEVLGCFPKIEVPKKHKNHFCSLPCGHLIHPGIFFIGIELSKKTDVLCNMMKDRHSSSVDLSFLLALHNKEILYLPKSEWSWFRSKCNPKCSNFVKDNWGVKEKGRAWLHDRHSSARDVTLTCNEKGAFQLRKADCACLFDTIAWLLVFFFSFFKNIQKDLDNQCIIQSIHSLFHG